MARWMKRPIFFSSFFSMKFSGSKFLTSAAIWQANLAESKLGDAGDAAFAGEQSLPDLLRGIAHATDQAEACDYDPASQTYLPAFRVLGDIVDRVLHGANLLGVFVGDFDVEGLFKGHDKFDGVERIGAQVVHKRGAGVTSPSSTPNCSTIICFTFSSTAAMFLLACLDYAVRGYAARAG